MPTTIPARHGAHLTLHPTQKLKILNPSGHQVVDCWAFPLANPPTWLSMAQTRSKLMRLRPLINDVLVDTRRQPVLKLCEDSSAGVHDMLFPPCDEHRYTEAGFPDHDSCGGNLRRELADYISTKTTTSNSSNEPLPEGLNSLQELESTIRNWGWTPEPFNLFMNVPWSGTQGELQVKAPACRANDFVVLEACVECVVVLSACPNDLLDTNGGEPMEVVFEVLT